MCANRFPLAADSVMLPGPAIVGRPPGGDFNAFLKQIVLDVQQCAGTCVPDVQTRQPAYRPGAVLGECRDLSQIRDALGVAE